MMTPEAIQASLNLMQNAQNPSNMFGSMAGAPGSMPAPGGASGATASDAPSAPGAGTDSSGTASAGTSGTGTAGTGTAGTGTGTGAGAGANPFAGLGGMGDMASIMQQLQNPEV